MTDYWTNLSTVNLFYGPPLPQYADHINMEKQEMRAVKKYFLF